MKRKVLAIMIAVMTISLSACGSAGQSDNESDVKKLEEKIEKLQSENKELGEQLATMGVSVEQKEDGEEKVSQTGLPDNFVAEANGICGENLVWEYGNDTLYIHGTGEMINYGGGSDVPWHKLLDQIAKVVIDEGCTSIGDKAFWYCHHICSVEMPNTLVRIGRDAFDSNELISIQIPDSVTNMEENPFEACKNLKSMRLSNNMEKVDFYDFTGYEKLTLPDEFNGVCSAVPEKIAIEGKLHEQAKSEADLKQLDPSVLLEEIRFLRVNSRIEASTYFLAMNSVVVWKGKSYSSDDAGKLVTDLIDAGIISFDNIDKSIQKKYYDETDPEEKEDYLDDVIEDIYENYKKLDK